MSQQLKEKKDLENQPPSKVAKSALVTMTGGGEKKGGGDNQKEIQTPRESEYMTEEDLGDFFEEESSNGFGKGLLSV